MIGMTGDTETIKRDENINGSLWCIVSTRLILRFRPLRGERLAQDLCDLVDLPNRIHPIDKIWGIQHQYIISTPQSERLPRNHQFFLSDLSQAIGIAVAEAEDLHVIAGVGCREGEKSRGEEHGFVIRVGDEEEDGFVGELGVGGACEVGGEEPKGGDEDGNGEDGVVVHGGHFGASSELEQCGCSRHWCCERPDRDRDRH